MSNRDDPTGPRRGQRKAERTRRLVVDRLVFLIEQGNDLQDMSVEQMLCGTRGRNDGVIHHSTLYHHLDKAGESSHRDRILQKGGLIARWLQEDDPASYVRWRQSLAERAGPPADMAALSFEQAQQQIGPHPQLSRSSTLSSDLKRYQRKLESLARYVPDMFLWPTDNEGAIDIVWSARYLETARYLTLLYGRAGDVEPEWRRAAQTAKKALRVFVDAVAASAHDGWVSALYPDLRHGGVRRRFGRSW